MENLLGSKYQLHCYKHNGKIHRTWDEIILLDETDEYIVCGNNHVQITESDGRSHQTKETTIIFLYKNRWFHVTAQCRTSGLFYKADMASPYLIDDKIIKYIDYDLDLKVFPNGEYKVLDCNEYKFHKKIMRYSKELDCIIKSELDSLIELKSLKKGPFDADAIAKYAEEFEKISEKSE